MKLDAFDGLAAMAEPHDLALAGPCADLQTRGQRLPPHEQRMVARRVERIRQALEDRLAVVLDRRRLAVHDALGADDLAAECCTERLMSEADTEDREAAGEALE